MSRSISPAVGHYLRNHVLILSIASSLFLLAAAHNISSLDDVETPLAVEPKSETKETIRNWIKNGGKTRIKIKINFSSDLKLPPEANCTGAVEKRNRESVEEIEETKRFQRRIVDSSRSQRQLQQIIFDWCHWEWSLEGHGGIWDEDFRFETYSLNIIKLATKEIDVDVGFGANANKTYFHDLTWVRKIRRVARAIKGTLDGIVASEEEKSARCGCVGESQTSSHSSDSDREKNNNGEPGSLLDGKSRLCFRAMRPDNHTFLKYSDTKDNQEIFKDTDYRLADICLRGVGNELEDARNHSSTRSGIFRSVVRFRIFLLIIVIAFLPLVLLRIYPKSEEVSNSLGEVQPVVEELIHRHGQGSQEVVDEMLHRLSVQPKTTSDTIKMASATMAAMTGATTGATTATTPVMAYVMNGANGAPLSFTAKSDPRDEAVVDVDDLVNFPSTTEETNERERFEIDSGSRNSLDQNGGCFLVKRSTIRTLLRPLARRNEYTYVAFDDHVPGMGFAGFFTAEIYLKWKWANCILSTIRRFLLFSFFSTHAIFVVAALDHRYHSDVVNGLFAFEKETNVRPLDLQYWNYFNRYSRWNPLCVAMVFCWLPILLVVSVPGVTKRCVESLYPSRYFGFYDIEEHLPLSLEKLEGLDKVERGMEVRAGLFFKRAFWKDIWQKWRGDRGSTLTKAFKFVVSLFCVYSLLPIFAPFPWDSFATFVDKTKSLSKNERIKVLASKFFEALLVSIFCLLFGIFFVKTADIYAHFIVFTVTATIFHYRLTLSLVGIVAGCVTFFYSVNKRVKNKYLAIKLTIFQIASELHEEKLKEIKKNDEKRNRYEAYWRRRTNDSAAATVEGTLAAVETFANADGRDDDVETFVPELVWKSADGSPYVPKRLYKTIVKELLPIGSERAKIALKMVLMGMFVAYIYTVMTALKMNEDDTAFDMAEALVTLVAVVLPSTLANLQSEQEKELRKERSKCYVKKLTEDFLRKNTSYYRYPTVPIEAAIDVRKNP